MHTCAYSDTEKPSVMPVTTRHHELHKNKKSCSKRLMNHIYWLVDLTDSLSVPIVVATYWRVKRISLNNSEFSLVLGVLSPFDPHCPKQHITMIYTQLIPSKFSYLHN